MAGSLTGSSTSTAGTVNLSPSTVTDWIKWESTSSVVRKSGGASLIGNYSVVGGATYAQYTNDPRTLTWTGGTPTASGSSTNGVFTSNSSGTGQGFQIVLPADTTSRTVVFYLGIFSGQGQLVCTLSDGSAGPLTLTSIATGGSTSGEMNATVTYQATIAGQTLTCVWTLTTNDGNGSNVTVCGANLTVHSVGGDVIGPQYLGGMPGVPGAQALFNQPLFAQTLASRLLGPSPVASAGPISGTASCSFSATATLSLTGIASASFSAVAVPSLSGTASASFAASATPTVSGTASASFQATATPTIAGTASCAFAALATTTVSGVASCSFAASGALSELVSGSASCSFVASAVPNISGTASCTFAATGALVELLSGTASASFAAVGMIASPIAGAASCSFSASAVASLNGIASCAFAGVGSFANPVNGTASCSFTASAVPTLAGVASASFSATGSLGGSGALSGQASCSFGATGALGGLGTLQGTATCSFDGFNAAPLTGTASCAFSAIGTVTARQLLVFVHATSIAVNTVTADSTAVSVANGSSTAGG